MTDAIMPASAAILGAVLLAFWIGSDVPAGLALRVPGLDRRPSDGGLSAATAVAPEAGTPQAGPGQPSSVVGSWPWLRGPEHDGISRDGIRLARSWPAAGPPVLWTVSMGEGYAGAVIGNGCVYVLDYDESAKADTMRCLSLDDGREIWRNGYPVEVTRNHGMSRTVPALIGDCVISIGPRCHVACWDARTGQCRWLLDMALTYGTTVPRWYTGQCPLIDGDRLILAPAGSALLVAIDYKTGEELWKTPNPNRWEMTHASVVPIEFQGQRMYVYCASGAVVGVAADDGRLLWQSTEWTVQFATAPSPVSLPGGQVFLCSGYGSKVGSLVLQLESQSGQLQARPLYRLTPKQFNSEQQTPILYEEHLFGVRKQGGGKLVCLDLSGQEVWNSGRDRVGHGPYLIADGVILALSNSGTLWMSEATAAGYRRLGQFQVYEDGQDAWGPMALAGGRLIVRDMSRMTCLDLKQPGT